MKYKVSLIVLLSFLVISCKKEPQLLVVSENFSEQSLSICQNTACPEVTVNYVEVIGNNDISEKINKQIIAFITESLYLGEDLDGAKFETIPEAATDFIKTYRMHSAEFPDMTTEYFAEVNVTDLYSSEKLICFELRQYMFSGGAHGYGSLSFLNVDPSTGEELHFADLVSDTEKLKTFVENRFRLEYKIPIDDSINSTGFWFENEQFYLPETIGFSNDHLIVHYNQYDIASYAAGPIELEIPLEEVKKFLLKI